MAVVDSGPAEAVSPVGRRVFVGMIGLGVAGIVFGSKVRSAIGSALSPVTESDPTGLTALLPTTGRFRFYSVVGFSPEPPADGYRLRVDGLVEEQLELDLGELGRMRQVELVKDFQCVTGWRVEDVPWKGVLVRDLLESAGVIDGATHVVFHSFDGVYTESLDLDQARRDDVIVALEMLGAAVSRDHGGPARLYVAPMYGYKSLKWLGRIEVVEQAAEGYWEARGYDTDAWIGGSNGRDDEPV
ncbi:MAG: Sulfoxide reductase catalytic subunit YedY [Acidimicrobiales bacterium]|nr:Sulfoxide reductase catalytic subunit YedY [Acidimicrobiales bacterium]